VNPAVWGKLSEESKTLMTSLLNKSPKVTKKNQIVKKKNLKKLHISNHFSVTIYLIKFTGKNIRQRCLETSLYFEFQSS
jgi:hypothetical protein